MINMTTGRNRRPLGAPVNLYRLVPLWRALGFGFTLVVAVCLVALTAFLALPASWAVMILLGVAHGSWAAVPAPGYVAVWALLTAFMLVSGWAELRMNLDGLS